MAITRTEAELQSAIETMFRVRAVESPPDDQGERTIWHRGHKGADLVTWVDAFGRVTRQELYLFDDCLIWEKASGVRTGETAEHEGSKLGPSPDGITFDSGADDIRIGRARKALQGYAGLDKFILHARLLVGGEKISDERLVTRNARAVSEEHVRLENERQTAPEGARQGQRLALIGMAVLVVGLILWILQLLT